MDLLPRDRSGCRVAQRPFGWKADIGVVLAPPSQARVSCRNKDSRPSEQLWASEELALPPPAAFCRSRSPVPALALVALPLLVRSTRRLSAIALVAVVAGWFSA